jgi:HEAT repeat protein
VSPLGGSPAAALPPPPTQGPVNPNAAAPVEEPDSLPVLARGLRHSDAVERRYAARALGREAALAARISEASAPGSDRDIEARLILQELDRLVTEPCLAAFDHDEVRRGCARVFAAVEATQTLPTLEAALEEELGLFTRRAVSAAVESLRAVSVEESP